MLWDIHIPTHVKLFLWRACRDCLPTRTRLCSKQVRCPSLCEMCGTDIESRWHALISCKDNKLCWLEAKFWHFIEPLLEISDSFADLFFTVCKSLNHDQRSYFSMVLWSLWKKRNDKVWENKVVSHSHVIRRAWDYLHSWKWARRRQADPPLADIQVNNTIWEPPPMGYLKCNVDAYFWENYGITSHGMCIRDHQGNFILAQTQWTQPLLRVKLQVSWQPCAGLNL